MTREDKKHGVGCLLILVFLYIFALMGRAASDRPLTREERYDNAVKAGDQMFKESAERHKYDNIR
jgi:hypothetical protein